MFTNLLGLNKRELWLKIFRGTSLLRQTFSTSKSCFVLKKKKHSRLNYFSFVMITSGKDMHSLMIF